MQILLPEYKFTHYTGAIIVECNVTTQYGYLHLHTPQCNSLMNTERKTHLYVYYYYSRFSET
jgi:hypothetical protein